MYMHVIGVSWKMAACGSCWEWG